jgi:membrane-bound metal-dependent hydrolase YbcI (DUF457 family)
MYLLGHFALGFFAALGVRRFTHEKINIPIVFFLSILPDIDVVIPRLVHRGPTHSILVATLLFLPILLLFRRGLPYFASVASHSLIGDYINPPVQMFWPISKAWYSFSINLYGETLYSLEIILFTIMVFIIIRNRKSIQRGKIIGFYYI